MFLRNCDSLILRFLFIPFLSHLLWNCIPLHAASRDSEVLINVIIGVTPPGSNGDQFKCGRPRETSTFMNCRPEGTGFPTRKATCECVNCALRVKLTCHQDFKWYPDRGVDICDVSNGKCGLCDVTTLHHLDLLCDRTIHGKPPREKNGYVTERRRCFCRSNCRTVVSTCEAAGDWQRPVLEACRIRNPVTKVSKKERLSERYEKGLVYYFCDVGLELQGNAVAQCSDGKLNSSRPTCVAPRNLITNPASSTLSFATTTRRPSTPLDEILTTLSSVDDPLPDPNDSFDSEASDQPPEFRFGGGGGGLFTDPNVEGIYFPHTPGQYYPTYPGRPSGGSRPPGNTKKVENSRKNGKGPLMPENLLPSSKPAISKKFPVVPAVIGGIGLVLVVALVLGLVIISRRYKLVCEPGTKRFSTLIGFTTNVKDLESSASSRSQQDHELKTICAKTYVKPTTLTQSR